VVSSPYRVSRISACENVWRPAAPATSSIPSAHRRVERVDERVLAELAQALQHVKLELLPENRRHDQQALGVVPEPRNTLTDDIFDAVGHRESPRRIARLQLCARGGDRAGLREVAQHFHDEERVAFGARIHQLSQLVRGSCADVNADELRHRRRIQRCERMSLEQTLATQVSDRRRHPIVDVKLRFTVGAEDHQPGLARVAKQVFE
jgi:hypothetical protein